MPEGYQCSKEGDCSYSWLDELLCEYVDGTMDPVVREAFEEYLGTDASLAAQVERLRCTRTLLCRHGCQLRAPRGLQARVRRRLAWEMMRPQAASYPGVAARLGAVVALGSVLVAVLMVGLWVGAAFFVGEQRAGERTATAPPVFRQDVRPPGLESAAMTPLPGQRPLGVPTLFEQPAPVLLPPSNVFYLMPGPFGATTAHPQPAGLQRSNGAP